MADTTQSSPIGFSSEESDLLLNILDPLIERCKEQGEPSRAAMALNLKSKIVHATLPKGITNAIRMSMEASMAEAIAGGHPSKIAAMFGRVLTMVTRVEADPGARIAEIVMSYLGNMQSGLTTHSFGALLDMISKKLKATMKDYVEADADAQTISLISYLQDWVATGKRDSLGGLQPWATDTDLFPGEAP